MTHTERSSKVVKCSEVTGRTIKNMQRENLGKIEEIVLDKMSGKTLYLVLECGSFLGMGGKFFAIPWNAIHFDSNEDCFILNMDKERLKTAKGFDKDHWPDGPDTLFGADTTTARRSETTF